MIHQFVTAMGIDIERSDSENISLGGIDNIDVSILNDFDYKNIISIFLVDSYPVI